MRAAPRVASTTWEYHPSQTIPRRLSASINRVEVSEPVSMQVMERIGAAAASLSSVELCVGSPCAWRKPLTMDFVRFFPPLTSLEVRDGVVGDLGPVTLHAASLRRLLVFRPGERTSLAPLASCERLRELRLVGPFRNFGDVAGAGCVRTLAWHGGRDTTLSAIAEATRLVHLKLVCGSVLSLSGVERLQNLQTLELCRCIRLRDLTPLASLARVRHMQLDGLPEVRVLPDCRKLLRLTKLVCLNLKRLNTVRELCTAPALREVRIGGTHMIKAKSFKPLESLESLSTFYVDMPKRAIADLPPRLRAMQSLAERATRSAIEQFQANSAIPVTPPGPLS